MGFMGQPRGSGLGAWRPKIITSKIAGLVSLLVDTVYIQDQDSANKLDVVTLGALNCLPVGIYDDSGAQTGLAANPLRIDPTGSTAQPVTGTFWQATQPVSGTFWQATQPVSGTFWQATQPVSATNLDIRDLTSVSDSIEANQATAADLNCTEASAADIKTAVQTIDNCISGSEAQVDVVAALPAGTNAIGKLAANTGVDIGDVDVTSIIPGVGATNLGKAEDAAHTTGDTGVFILGIRDDTLSVFSGTEGDYEPFHMTAAGRLYTSATIDAALPAGTNAIGKLAANNGVDIGDVDVKSIAAGTNAIGKLAANSGVDIGDVDVTSVIPGVGATNLGKAEDAAHTSGDTGIMALGIRDDTLSVFSGAENDYEPFHMTSTGRLYVSAAVDTALPAGTAIIGAVKLDVTNYTKVRKYVALGTTGETTIWDPSAGTKFVITDIFVSATAAGTCTLKDGTAGTTFLIASLAANGGFVTNLVTPIQSTTADNNLTATASATTQYVSVCGYEV